MARTGRHAQPERLADQSGREVQHALERRLQDDFFLDGLRRWLDGELLASSTISHVRRCSDLNCPKSAEQTGSRTRAAAASEQGDHGRLRRGLHGHVQRHHSRRIPASDGRVQGAAQPVDAVRRHAARFGGAKRRRSATGWTQKGLRFNIGHDPATELTEAQILDQCRMYIAALRLADEFGCDDHRHSVSAGAERSGARIGSGRRPAEQLSTGLPFGSTDASLYAGQCAAALQRGRRVRGARRPGDQPGLAASSGFAPENTLHDVRYGEEYNGEFVWVFEISGAAPPRALHRRVRRARSANGSRQCTFPPAAGR